MGRQPPKRVVDIAGIAVCLEGSDHRRSAAVEALLRGLRNSEQPPVAAIRYAPDPPDLPLRQPDLTYGDLRMWWENNDLFLQHASDVRGRVSDHEVHIGGGDGQIERAFARLFHPAVTHLLAGHGRFVLHAAAIAGPSQAVLVLGHTGTGKSTLALAGVHSGWRLLGDDLAAVRVVTGRPEVTGIARRTALPGDLGTDALAAGRPVPGDHRDRWELPPDQLEPGWFPVVAVLGSGHGDRPTGRLRRWEPHALLDMVLASFTSVVDPPRLRRFLPCAAAVARLPAWQLELGSDPMTRLADAGELLEQVAASTTSAQVRC